MATWTQRMIGAAKLDVATYEEVEADSGATMQAMLAVVVAAIAAGVGQASRGGSKAFVIGTIGALIGWFLWALLTWLIGTKLLPEAETHADMGQLLRTTGFSASPGILKVLGGIPGLGFLITLAASLWMLAAMVVAVRQALDYKSTGRAIGVCLIGFLVNMAVAIGVAVLVGGGAAALTGGAEGGAN